MVLSKRDFFKKTERRGGKEGGEESETTKPTGASSPPLQKEFRVLSFQLLTPSLVRFDYRRGKER